MRRSSGTSALVIDREIIAITDAEIDSPVMVTPQKARLLIHVTMIERRTFIFLSLAGWGIEPDNISNLEGFPFKEGFNPNKRRFQIHDRISEWAWMTAREFA
jgi:hypothetical protein